MNKKLTIKEWEKSDRPREKFIEKGGTALTNSELIAVLIGSGTKQKNAIEIGRELLNESGNSLRNLFSKSYDELIKCEGIGFSKGVHLAVVGEIIKRTQSEVKESAPQIYSPQNAVDIMAPLLKDLSHEECWALYLNRGNRVISKELITSGGISSTVMDVRIIIKKGLSKLASGIILFHNHPSGNPTPGKNDITQTKRLKEALKNCDIELIDHIIIAGDGYFSFANESTI